MKRKLVFLKLGGSVITDKDRPNTANLERMDIIAGEILRAQKEEPALSLLIGHGSGSFGHFAAEKFNTRSGASTLRDWQGFAEVAYRARELNQIVLECLRQASINALSISPLSSIVAENRQVKVWDSSILEECLLHGITPVIYGDVILDRQLGGTILSTEELFAWLAPILQPQRILLAGLEQGVWKEYPKRTEIIKEINSQNSTEFMPGIHGSAQTDVTGGMKSKVQAMVDLVNLLPELEIQIFSASHPGNIYSTLRGSHKGTLIRYSKG